MQITDADFERLVLNSKRPVLVDFWASWCPPCKMMEPVVERLRDDVLETASVVAVNIDRNPETAAKYQISSVPTFVSFANGQPVARQTGAATVSQLRGLIDDATHAMVGEPDDENDACVTVVTGLPRSGTSMMMRMLEAGGLATLTDHQRPADEDNPNGYYELEAVKQTAVDAGWLDRAPGRCVKMVYRLVRDLPPTHQYKVLFMRRNVDEVLASQRRMLERQTGEPIIGSDQKMKRLFLEELKQFDAWMDAQQHLTAHIVSYNGLMCQPRLWAERVDDFLGNNLDLDSMIQVVDPALYRNRVA